MNKSDDVELMDIEKGSYNMRDFIAPPSMQRGELDYMTVGKQYVRNFVMQGFPNQVYVYWLDALFNSEAEIDTMILGCTHYPILLPKIQKYTPKHIRIVAQGEYVAESLKDYLSRHPEMNAKCTQNGSCLFYTTEAEEKFVESASSFLNQQIDVKRISLE